MNISPARRHVGLLGAGLPLAGRAREAQARCGATFLVLGRGIPADMDRDNARLEP